MQSRKEHLLKTADQSKMNPLSSRISEIALFSPSVKTLLTPLYSASQAPLEFEPETKGFSITDIKLFSSLSEGDINILAQHRCSTNKRTILHRIVLTNEAILSPNPPISPVAHNFFANLNLLFTKWAIQLEEIDGTRLTHRVLANESVLFMRELIRLSKSVHREKFTIPGFTRSFLEHPDTIYKYLNDVDRENRSQKVAALGIAPIRIRELREVRELQKGKDRLAQENRRLADELEQIKNKAKEETDALQPLRQTLPGASEPSTLESVKAASEEHVRKLQAMLTSVSQAEEKERAYQTALNKLAYTETACKAEQQRCAEMAGELQTKDKERLELLTVVRDARASLQRQQTEATKKNTELSAKISDLEQIIAINTRERDALVLNVQKLTATIHHQVETLTRTGVETAEQKQHIATLTEKVRELERNIQILTAECAVLQGQKQQMGQIMPEVTKHLSSAMSALVSLAPALIPVVAEQQMSAQAHASDDPANGNAFFARNSVTKQGKRSTETGVGSYPKRRATDRLEALAACTSEQHEDSANLNTIKLTG